MHKGRHAKAPQHGAVYIRIAYFVVSNYKRRIYRCRTASEGDTFISYLLRSAFSKHVQQKRALKQTAVCNNRTISRFHIAISAEGAAGKLSVVMWNYVYQALLKQLQFS
jgi:hypothetical protein